MAIKKSKIMKAFKNKCVSIVCKDIKMRGGNTAFSGFLLDEDADNYFLGDEEENSIQAAIPKNQIACITLIDPMELLMEAIQVPGDQEVQ